MRRVLLVAAALLAGCGGGGGDEPERRDVGPAPPAPTRDPAPHLEALQRIADRNDGTRAAGTGGDRETVAYIVRTLRAAGWRVREQRVRFPYFERRSTPRLGNLRPGREVRAAEYSGSATLRERVVRLRTRGCSTSDFAGVRGRIALVDRGTCFFTQKARNAEAAGARALVVSDTYGRTPVSATLIRPGRKIPVLIVTAPAAERIAGRTVRIDVDAVSERRTTTNVIAETRPAPRTLMAGAHHDSVTAGPGLNDNGSGIAALLALAVRLRDRPGLRFGFWGGEELALYGSRRYVNSLSATERKAISGYLNFDMLGSPNGRIEVYDRDDRIERALRRALPGPERDVKLEGASDHAPFERAGIPVGGLFTGAADRGRGPGAADRCYHRRCDTLENVNRDLLERMTDAAERALLALRR
jgi:Iap family predicted aminopeptidase